MFLRLRAFNLLLSADGRPTLINVAHVIRVGAYVADDGGELEEAIAGMETDAGASDPWPRPGAWLVLVDHEDPVHVYETVDEINAALGRAVLTTAPVK